MTVAPIILFTYQRPEHTRLTLEALSANHLASESDLIVYSDAPANDLALSGVNETRALLADIQGFKSVRVIEQEVNQGLSNSIIQGVTQVLLENDSVIVLEDDLITSPYFLKFMNEGLMKYSERPEVATIQGYSFPTGDDPRDNYFLRFFASWGWATWKDQWQGFNADGAELLDRLKRTGQHHDFDFAGAFPFTRMLTDQVSGKIDSWAIRWYASTYLAHKLSLYPRYSLLNTIGLDDSGVNCTVEDLFFSTEVYQSELPVSVVEPVENIEMREATARYFKRSLPGFGQRVMSKLRRLFVGAFPGD